MFSFIHAADLHIDSPMDGLENWTDAPIEEIRGATRRALENLVSLAIAERVAFVVISGDLYDGDWKDYRTGLFVHRQFHRLEEAGIRVLVIYGNHDAESVVTSKLTLPRNVSVFPTDQATTIELEGVPVAVHGRGFANRSVAENLVPGYPDPVPGRFNVGMLHTSLNGREGHDSYAPCSEQDLLGKGYGYWALGHIHMPEIVRQGNCWIVYAGNTQGRSVRETGPRGCQLVRVDGSLRVTAVEHRCLDVVRWAHELVDVTGVDGEMQLADRVREAVQRAAEPCGDRLLAVRLTLHGATSLHDLLTREYERWEVDVRNMAETAGVRVCVEKLKRKTKPIGDAEDGQGSDEMVGLVLDALGNLSRDATLIPKEITQLVAWLPASVQGTVRNGLEGKNRDTVLEEVRSMLMAILRADSGDSP